MSRLRSVLVALLAPLASAACGEREAAEPPAAAVQVASAVPAAVEPIRPGTRLPPADAPLRYVGRWAAAEAGCRDAVWIFREENLESPRGMVCAFDNVARTAAGYALSAACSGESPAAGRRIELRFAESAKAMLMDGAPGGGSVGLVWCGPL